MIDNLSDIDGQTELAKTFNKSHVTDAQNQYDPNDESLGQKQFKELIAKSRELIDELQFEQQQEMTGMNQDNDDGSNQVEKNLLQL